MRPLLILLAATALAGGAATCALAAPAARAAAAQPSAEQPPADRQVRLRRGGHGPQRRAGRRLLRFCQRHLGEEHADPGRPRQLTACSTCSRTSRTSGCAGSSRRRQRRPGSKIGDLYASFIDVDAAEGEGLRSGQAAARRDRRGRDAQRLRQAARHSRCATGSAGRSAPMSAIDDKNPDQTVVQISQAGLGLPDRDYYLKPDAKLAEAKAAYATYLARLFTLGRRGRRRRAGAGDHRFRGQDRRGAVDPHREPRFGQDL